MKWCECGVPNLPTGCRRHARNSNCCYYCCDSFPENRVDAAVRQGGALVFYSLLLRAKLSVLRVSVLGR